MHHLGKSVLLILALLLPAPALAQRDDVKACESGSVKVAVAACGRLIASGGYNGREHFLYNMRGGAYQRSEEHERAITDFDRAAQLDPKFTPAYINRGVSWASLGEYDRAIEDFGEAHRLDPKNPLVFNNRGGAYRDKGEFDRAMADFDRAIALDPKYGIARYNRGNVFQDKGEFDRAIADYNQVVRHSPKDTDALRARGRAWSNKGDYQRARADYRLAIATPARDQQGRDVQAAVRVLLGVIEKTEEDRKREEERKRLERLELERQKQKAAPSKQAPPSIEPALPTRKPPSSGAREAPSRSRVALVMGNSRYLAFRELVNPRNDAEDVAQMLKGLGFEVHLGLDLAHAEMKAALTKFSERVRLADTALVFYAGHGLQRDSTNYLAPVDAQIDEANTLQNLVNLQSIIANLEGARRVRLLIIDACRDSGAVQQVASRQLNLTRSVGITRGLARVEIEDGKGTLIAFATQPNNVATDGAGRNSPFTSALLKHFSTPGLELRTLLTRVRAEVVNATSGRQRPEVVDSLVGEVVFKTAN